MKKIYFTSKLFNDLGVKHGFFSRNGGFSKGVYESLNFKLSGDELEENIRKNLTVVAKSLDINPEMILRLKQVHSDIVIDVKKQNKSFKQGDALVTERNNAGLSVVTADCMPILLYGKSKGMVAAVHAGWKGALKKIIAKTVGVINNYGGQDIYAAIGPCIRQKSYEVGKEFYQAFIIDGKKNERFFLSSNNNSGKYFFDLPGYCEAQLVNSGVKQVDDIMLNTYDNKEHFFSCRRAFHNNEKDFGAQMSVIALD